jgi:hypothetical protein
LLKQICYFNIFLFIEDQLFYFIIKSVTKYEFVIYIYKNLLIQIQIKLILLIKLKILINNKEVYNKLAIYSSNLCYTISWKCYFAKNKSISLCFNLEEQVLFTKKLNLFYYFISKYCKDVQLTKIFLKANFYDYLSKFYQNILNLKILMETKFITYYLR